jgi:hypothetical protein
MEPEVQLGHLHNQAHPALVTDIDFSPPKPFALPARLTTTANAATD